MIKHVTKVKQTNARAAEAIGKCVMEETRTMCRHNEYSSL